MGNVDQQKYIYSIYIQGFTEQLPLVPDDACPASRLLFKSMRSKTLSR
jgi:hypothetical protein